RKSRKTTNLNCWQKVKIVKGAKFVLLFLIPFHTASSCYNDCALNFTSRREMQSDVTLSSFIKNSVVGSLFNIGKILFQYLRYKCSKSKSCPKNHCGCSVGDVANKKRDDVIIYGFRPMTEADKQEERRYQKVKQEQERLRKLEQQNNIEQQKQQAYIVQLK